MGDTQVDLYNVMREAYNNYNNKNNSVIPITLHAACDQLESNITNGLKAIEF